MHWSSNIKQFQITDTLHLPVTNLSFGMHHSNLSKRNSISNCSNYVAAQNPFVITLLFNFYSKSFLKLIFTCTFLYYFIASFNILFYPRFVHFSALCNFSVCSGLQLTSQLSSASCHIFSLWSPLQFTVWKSSFFTNCPWNTRRTKLLQYW